MKILVAEDDEDTRHSCRMLLELEGHEVRTAADGQEAVDVDAQFWPDLVMLDIGMPRKNGFQAAREIHSLHPQAVLVAVSGWPLRAEFDFRQGGFDEYLLKPVEMVGLCDTVFIRALASRTWGARRCESLAVV